jgi:hypothetical protein
MIKMDKYEKVICGITAFLCVLVAVLDFFGVWENISWIHDNIQNMILVCVGLFCSYLIIINEKITSGFTKNDELVGRISSQVAQFSFGKDQRSILEIIDNVETAWIADIDVFFEKAKESIDPKSDIDAGIKAIKIFVANCRKEFLQGNILGTKQNYPWDCTLSIVDLTGKLIDHDCKSMENTRHANENPWHTIIEKKGGNFWWFDSYKSARANDLLTEGCPIRRITKFNFKILPKINLILVLELHINVVSQFPITKKDY